MPKKLTKEDISLRLKQRFPEEEFEIVKYDGTGKPAIFRCKKCGKDIETSKAVNFFAKNKRYGCVNCYGLWRDRDEKLKKILERYDILDTYVHDTHTYYKIKCKKCGHVRESSLSNLYNHLECGCSTGIIHYTDEELKDKLFKYADGFDLLSDFNGVTKKVLLKCRKCGFVWSTTPANLFDKRRDDILCPKCRRLLKISKGERLIEKILIENNINYIREYSLRNCKQRLDFFLPDYNVGIEFNGLQHYKYIEFFHKSVDGFKKYQERDKKKQEYCKEHNIELIVIPYYYTKEDVINSTTILKRSTL